MNATRNELPVWRKLVTDEDSRSWAVLLRDDNPLHGDSTAADSLGLGEGLVVPGPAGIAYLMTLLVEAFPGAEIRSFSSRFIAPVIAPTEVAASGVVERRERGHGGEILHLALQLHARETLAVTARAVAHLPDSRA